MIQHQVYKCPKCLNTLLVSNKMLHDLRCTTDHPATYENILFRQSQQMSSNSNDSDYSQNSPQRLSTRMSIQNEDGTSFDIIRGKSIRGKEELIEIKYDPSGNVISRKKADYFIPENHLNDLNDDSEDDDNFKSNYDNNNNTYYEVNNEAEIKKTPSVIIETVEPQEIIYEAPAKYDTHVTINKPIEETIIKSDSVLNDGILDNILRNTMSRDTNNYNIPNDINNNTYNFYQDYAQTNNEYNQINNHSIYNDPSQANSNSIDIYSEEILRKTAGMGNMNSNSYDYQY